MAKITTSQAAQAIIEKKGIITHAAKTLGISRTHLHYLINKHPTVKEALLDAHKEKIKQSQEPLKITLPNKPDGKGARFIYLVKEDFLGLVKIGIAKNLHSRISGIQTSCPQNLTILGYFQTKAAKGIETFLHDRFANKRYRGEWYKLTDDDVKFILNDNYFNSKDTPPSILNHAVAQYDYSSFVQKTFFDDE
ncbi:hypothetical protein LCGC14_2874270 [marine sediment metagenome]|uniref:Bacteriophage T5 Orf172 DNA-binding domain-containing protein n=1 Tax=marine sediment metagenome TaxID=412755 RepID=A0A0F8Y285_9ZZZZ